MKRTHLHTEQFDGAMHPWCGRGTTAVPSKQFDATDPKLRCRLCEREWFPNGQPDWHRDAATTTLTIGHTYRVASTRKGKFTGKLVRQDDTWATLEITSGRAGAMLPENVREKGEEVIVRREWCTFTEVTNNHTASS